MFSLSETVTVPIIVATIAAVGGIVVAVVTSFRRENKKDHLSNQGILLQIDDKIDHIQERLEDRMTRVEQKVDRHIAFHVEQEKQAMREVKRARKR